ncbi:ATP-binding protein [Zavarzinia compransoris]|uniref:ATP-binding protein n=1 Tax=Zavarzinia compransoris TaxID=1264899 RepID=UPI0010DF9FF6|nr:ATP-binding protein [Zavarzinia compransoris]TDP46384.1 two-component system OmpR family sensor kinase [Zavarzinia compransoris]
MKRSLSLRRTLSRWLTVLLALVGILTGALSYLLTLKEAAEFFDQQLRQVALNVGDPGVQGLPPQRPPADEIYDQEDDFAVQIWDRRDEIVQSSPPEAADIPRHSSTGYSDTSSGGLAWRTYTLVTPRRTVQISQQVEVQRELAEAAALRSMLPVAIAIPLSWLLLIVVVRRITIGLNRLAQSLARRSADDDAAFRLDNIPAEVAPLVTEMERLLGRLQSVVAVQRRFVSEAAHELRTPLAALQLQAGNLDRIGDPATRAARIAELKQGIRRASLLVDQLLKIARQEAGSTGTGFAAIDLLELIKEVVASILPIADHRRQDIGLTHTDTAVVFGNPSDLRTLFGNLVENALRYTPEDGTIDIAVRRAGDSVFVEISDSGPGIPEHLMTRVFDPFFRAASADIEGSGLGLAIAARIAARHGTAIELANRPDGRGLVARVSLNIREPGDRLPVTPKNR